MIFQILIFSVPSGVLSAEEQRDMMLMIAGQKPVGKPICEINSARQGN